MTRHARCVPVLMYHHISSSPGMITVSPEHFAAQMDYVARAGYTTVGAAQLAAYLSGEPLPRKSIVLTFDDGYLDNWVHAHPVLAKHGQTALCFLVTKWVGEGQVRPNAAGRDPLPALLNHAKGEAAIGKGEPDRTILRWSEIDAMREAGTFEFHSHTHTHIRWDQREKGNVERKCAGLSQDLVAARATLSERLGAASDHLCWPQGYYDADYQRVATAAGFKHFYTCEPGSNYPRGSSADVHSISRLEVRNKPASWLASRLWVHTRPLVSRAYLRIKR